MRAQRATPEHARTLAELPEAFQLPSPAEADAWLRSSRSRLCGQGDGGGCSVGVG
jgi:hypothetical protein